jgi:pyruvate ferredoxin oxidoreductase alpha subunit
MGTKKIQEASRAVEEAVRLCNVNVIPLYPITPQTHVVEALTEFVNNGELNAEVINVESEHSAMSAAIGASAVGTRVFTATSSQGLKYMSEVLFIAAGLRLPIVMMVANRALSSPINIWNDHSDTIAERDSGWIQFYCESTQEAVDFTIQSFKISEKTIIPSMVCLDGFTLTHVYENVNMSEQKEVDEFLPKLNLKFKLDTEKPITIGPVCAPNSYMEVKKMQQEDMNKSLEEIKKIQQEYEKKFKRKQFIFDGYECEDAEKIIVCMGTICGTAREVASNLRKKGKKFGVLKISLFRPFPREEISKFISKCKKLKNLIVLDRAVSFGNKGVLFTELRDLLYDSKSEGKFNINGYIVGLGGRDVTQNHIQKAFDLAKEEWLL